VKEPTVSIKPSAIGRKSFGKTLAFLDAQKAFEKGSTREDADYRLVLLPQIVRQENIMENDRQIGLSLKWRTDGPGSASGKRGKQVIEEKSRRKRKWQQKKSQWSVEI
jgi:hypothetical protein